MATVRAEKNVGGGEHSSRTWVARVVVTPKPGVNDPEGEAILGGLMSLGYRDVDRVRSGRYFEVTIAAGDAREAEAAVTEMCGRLLANPVIEAYRVTVEEDGAAVGTSAEVEWATSA